MNNNHVHSEADVVLILKALCRGAPDWTHEHGKWEASELLAYISRGKECIPSLQGQNDRGCWSIF